MCVHYQWVDKKAASLLNKWNDQVSTDSSRSASTDSMDFKGLFNNVEWQTIVFLQFWTFVWIKWWMRSRLQFLRLDSIFFSIVTTWPFRWDLGIVFTSVAVWLLQLYTTETFIITSITISSRHTLISIMLSLISLLFRFIVHVGIHEFLFFCVFLLF